MTQRQAPGQIGQIQRQVTAAPTATLQAFQQQAYIDPSADDFAKGLAQFADTVSGVVRQQRDEALDAQAAVADIGMDGYNRAMSGALKARPELFDSPEELTKLDQEMRGTYFKDVTDEKILGRINGRLDTWLQSEGQTYQFAKEEKKRFDLGFSTLKLSIEKLEEGKRNGAVSEEQALEAVKGVVNHLRSSPTFQLSQGSTEELVKGLQEVYAKDGSHRVLLAKAFMDDESISPEVRLALQADYAEGMAMTKLEREQQQFEVLQGLTGMVQKGQLTSAKVQPYVASGLLTAEAGMGLLNQQRTLLEKRAKEAQERSALMEGNLDRMTGAQRRKHLFALKDSLSPEAYNNFLRNTGLVDPEYENRAKRALNLANGFVETPEQIPQAFQESQELFQNLRSQGMLEQQIGPENALKVHLYQALKEGGKSDVEAYNASQSANPYAKMSDIDRQTMASFKTNIRDALGQEGMASYETDLAAYYALHLSKTGLEADEATERAKDFIDKAYQVTPYGPVSKAILGGAGVSPEALERNLDYAVKKLAETDDSIDPDDLQVTLFPDGKFIFRRRYSDVPIQVRFDLMTSPESAVGGQQTVTGARQQDVINGILEDRPSTTTRVGGPLIGGG